MRNVNVNMTIDRLASGNARVHGKVGDNSQDVNVWKGPQPGDAYIEGTQSGEATTLRINSAFSDNGQGIFGRVAGVSFKGNWAQEASEGDVTMMLDKATLTLDQTPSTGTTQAAAPRLKATAQILNAEGDENLTLLADGQQIKLSIDRQSDGDIEIRGRDGAGPFRLRMERKGDRGDLHIKGTMPENLALLPVMWELYGNDSMQPPAQPLSMGAVASLSAFWDTQLT